MTPLLNDTSVLSDKVTETPTARLVKYVLLQILQVPALLWSIFIFYCVYRGRELRRLHNHAMLLILLTCFLILVSELCLFWIFANDALLGMTTLLMAFASIERFVLIYFSTFIMRSRRRRVWFHYMPMIFCCAGVIIWYAVLVLINPCANSFNFSLFLCSYASYQSDVVTDSFDCYFL